MWAARTGTRGGAGAMGLDDANTLFEGLVPVVVQREGREPVTEVFLVAVVSVGDARTAAAAPPAGSPSAVHVGNAAAATGNANPRRAVHIRITSPADAFLLHTATITEDEYPAFRERNGLRFDFARFPSVLVNLLEERGGEPASTLAAAAAALASDSPAAAAATATPSPHHTADAANPAGVVSRSCRLQLDPAPSPRGRFQFCQADRYRDSEVMGIAVVQEDDAGQKRHLAQRVGALLAELAGVTDELKATAASLHERTDVYERTVGTVRGERDGFEKQLLQLQGELKLQHEQRERSLADNHRDEVQGLAQKAAEQLAATTTRFESEVAALREALQRAEADRDALATAKAALEKEVRGVTANRDDLAADNTRLAARVASAEADAARHVEQLQQTTRENNQKSLQIVGLEERLKGVTDMLDSERTRHEGAAGMLKEASTEAERWAAQNQHTLKQVAEREADLKKAQYIIKTMHAKFRDTKAKKDKAEEDVAARDAQVASLTDALKHAEEELKKAEGSLLEKRGEVMTLAQENENLQKSLTEANACIEYHHRNSRFAFSSKSTGVSGMSSSLASGMKTASASPPVLATARTTSSIGGGSYSSKLANGIAAAQFVSSSPPAAATPPAAARPVAATPSPASASMSDRPDRDAVSARARNPVSTAPGRPPAAASLLTSSPSRASELVGNSRALWSMGAGTAGGGASDGRTATAAAAAPSNFFVASVTGPIGTTA